MMNNRNPNLRLDARQLVQSGVDFVASPRGVFATSPKSGGLHSPSEEKRASQRLSQSGFNLANTGPPSRRPSGGSWADGDSPTLHAYKQPTKAQAQRGRRDLQNPHNVESNYLKKRSKSTVETDVHGGDLHTFDLGNANIRKSKTHPQDVVIVKRRSSSKSSGGLSSRSPSQKRFRLSTGGIAPSTPDEAPALTPTLAEKLIVSDDARGKIRQSVLKALTGELDTKTMSRLSEITHQLDANRHPVSHHIVKELQQIKITKDALERTGVGKALSKRVKESDQISDLVDGWKKKLRKELDLSQALETELLRVNVPDNQINSVNNQTIHKNQNNWVQTRRTHYMNEARMLITTLKKDFMQKTKQDLLSGRLSPKELLAKNNRDEYFLSPKQKAVRLESSRRLSSQADIPLPFADEQMECPGCRKAGGVRYEVKYEDESRRALTCRCGLCNFQWQKDEQE